MMRISHDSFARIAAGKKVCQDFATSGDQGGFPHAPYRPPYGILSDGCSTALHSEFGAADLVSSLEPYLFPGCDFQHAFMGACGRADAMRAIRGRDEQSLYATLLCIMLDGGMLRSAMSGDGFEVFRRRGTSIYEVRHVSFTDNAPPYPIYFLTPDMTQYNAMCELKNNVRIVSNIVIDVNSSEIEMDEARYSIPWKHLPTQERSITAYDLALSFSDGLGSFQDIHDNDVPLLEVLRVFLDFKSLHGQFIQRRMNFAWDEVAKRGWRNTDDFSVAGISCIE